MELFKKCIAKFFISCLRILLSVSSYILYSFFLNLSVKFCSFKAQADSQFVYIVKIQKNPKISWSQILQVLVFAFANWKHLIDMEEIERTEPKPKRFKPAVDFKNFDIVGTLMTEMGLTGENLTRQIFSYLDMTSLVCVRKVSNIWQRFMIREKSIWTLIWMVELRKFEPHLEFIKNSLFRNKKRKRSFSFASNTRANEGSPWKK